MQGLTMAIGKAGYTYFAQQLMAHQLLGRQGKPAAKGHSQRPGQITASGRHRVRTGCGVDVQ